MGTTARIAIVATRIPVYRGEAHWMTS